MRVCKKMRRLLLRAYHLWERIVKESKVFPSHYKNFGWKVAFAAWWDGLIPPGKTAKYITTIEEFVDRSVDNVIAEFKEKELDEKGCLTIRHTPKKDLTKIPVWCCWWQGEESMPELVKMCDKRLKQVIPKDIAELHRITLDNYQEYVDIPAHILEEFEQKKITMTTLSDILRFQLLSNYGGFWIDSTVYISEKIPDEFFQKRYFSQKMKNVKDWQREACKGRWCGFLMAGPAHHIIFEYMNAAFATWWEKYDDIADYVLIDYLLLTGYKYIPAIREAVDQVLPNNEYVFRMYGLLNQPFTEELYCNLTNDTIFHKLTYKMDLRKKTEAGDDTLYKVLLNKVGMR